jgi:hypothetical protein
MENNTMEDNVYTKLIDKHYSPVVIRKITHFGFPIYVGIITDDSLSNFDEEIMSFIEENKATGWVNDIQKVRNFAGALTERMVEVYGKAEAVAVVLMVDKTFISSLYGDFMNHAMCRQELYFLLNMSTGV